MNTSSEFFGQDIAERSIRVVEAVCSHKCPMLWQGMLFPRPAIYHIKEKKVGQRHTAAVQKFNPLQTLLRLLPLGLEFLHVINLWPFGTATSHQGGSGRGKWSINVNNNSRSFYFYEEVSSGEEVPLKYYGANGKHYGEKIHVALSAEMNFDFIG